MKDHFYVVSLKTTRHKINQEALDDYCELMKRKGIENVDIDMGWGCTPSGKLHFQFVELEEARAFSAKYNAIIEILKYSEGHWFKGEIK